MTKKRKLSYKANVIINEQPINQVNYTKFLGLYIDEELTWKYHIDHVTMKVAKMTGIMAKARHFLPLKTLLTHIVQHHDLPIFNILQHYLGEHVPH